MKLDIRSNGVIVRDFWNCNCNGNYMHRNHLKFCPKCGAREENSPDADGEELAYFYSELLTTAEYKELLYALGESVDEEEELEEGAEE